MIDKKSTYSMSCDHCGLLYEGFDGTTHFQSRGLLREMATYEGWGLIENKDECMHLCHDCYREYCFTTTGKLPE